MIIKICVWWVPSNDVVISTIKMVVKVQFTGLEHYNDFFIGTTFKNTPEARPFIKNLISNLLMNV